ncbi:LysE family translocator [Xenorhabdus szentirmaii]|uniref:Homoserine/threonine efflux protein (LysE-type family translocator) n=1 Tax=Xenorhabdus szentirmaii DSM 16338 TaxID=1427518 RepID=W1IZU6_9GAMM|nr:MULTISPECIES: LysE family translocator [Xenorhabdus]MBD2780663.1 LysE family translocator [Xenorhabdus sp. 38]PHM34450.1 lysine transporter LysE [Xenorhabdus szentirmaii DSM 16338]PHM43179.1 lysine transporter LysE [Xenorhabdus szentirmaii]CDL83964.1 Homoserine/threonine efflux protein (LysE-type family translocator) [Xenorhabdus szentirmaii DSM 16338]
MIPMETLIAFISISTFLCLLPGPDNILVLSQSAINGRKAGVSITIGLCIGLLIHTSLVSLGISAMIRANAVAFEIIRILGVIYLSYLAWGAFNAKPACLKTSNEKFNQTNQLIKKGLIMNLSNPKVIIFFLAFLPQFTINSKNTIPIPFQLLYLGLLFAIIAFFVFTLISYLSGFLNDILANKPSIQTVLNKITSFIFIALAINLAISQF